MRLDVQITLLSLLTISALGASATTTAPFIAADTTVIRAGDHEVVVETAAPQAARARLEQLKVQNPDAFSRAGIALAQHGCKATETIVVRHVSRRPAKKVQPTESYTDGDTEIVFWSWDDGDNATWEGEIYVINHSSGAEMLLDGQFDTTTQSLPVSWESTVYRRGPMTAPAEGSPTTSLPREDSVQVAGLGNQGILAAVHAMRSNSIELVQTGPRRRLQHWAECAGGGCWSGLLACRFTGPAWVDCAAGTCMAVMVACAWDALFM